ncbi:IS3 family transposase [Inediibacterium massiliense]|uniref:IS3 family transposase n=1 Tax=Inediibacterium massiliense TaxID=1658111 RepID=UPI000DA5F971|nr:IS3 family transposase [Inediibacterium massiliense]
MANKKYDPELQKKVLRLYLEEGRTVKSLTEEYNLGNGTLRYWLNKHREECKTNTDLKEETDSYIEIQKLRKQLEELEKENRFLKKAAGILRERNRLKIYEFIKKYCNEFGLRWLLSKFKLSPNAYYNYLKKRKQKYFKHKAQLKELIETIYHSKNGTVGYRMIADLLKLSNVSCSYPTIYKYRKELNLKAIIMKKKQKYIKGSIHKTFKNLLNQDVTASKRNEKWCTDFTYLTLSNGQKRYNCSIIDLYDRSVVATLNSKWIDSNLAIDTLKIALKNNLIKNNLILHSDQGAQFASKEFVKFCESKGVTQSMSKAGCPYDNAVMERFYNTFKNELIKQYRFDTDQLLNEAVNDYVYEWYNFSRPHSHNQGRTPFEARYGNQN